MAKKYWEFDFETRTALTLLYRAVKKAMYTQQKERQDFYVGVVATMQTIFKINKKEVVKRFDKDIYVAEDKNYIFGEMPSINEIKSTLEKNLPTFKWKPKDFGYNEMLNLTEYLNLSKENLQSTDLRRAENAKGEVFLFNTIFSINEYGFVVGFNPFLNRITFNYLVKEFSPCDK